MKLLRVIFAFFAAVITATIGLSAASTFTVLANLDAMGHPVPLGLQLTTYIRDIIGLAPAAGPINAIGLAIAFIIAALIIRFAWDRRLIGYTLAGFVALIAEMVAMGMMFGGITPIAGARTMGGLLAIGAVGALSGFIFARISASR